MEFDTKCVNGIINFNMSRIDCKFVIIKTTFLIDQKSRIKIKYIKNNNILKDETKDAFKFLCVNWYIHEDKTYEELKNNSTDLLLAFSLGSIDDVNYNVGTLTCDNIILDLQNILLSGNVHVRIIGYL